MNDVRNWLESLGLTQYIDAFESNDVDLDVLPSLNEGDLEKLGVSLGHRKKMLKVLVELEGGASDAAPSVGRVPPASQAPENPPTKSEAAGERRQLTVMFCDLVGSTALSEKLDPEELRSLLHNYRTVCGEVIARYEGFVARYVGDGILTYFGWPKAHEDDAERSIHAALEIVESVKTINPAGSMRVRIGIATGAVVVGEQAGQGDQSKLAIGSTPNLAARLQGMAQVDEIIIAASTRRLVGSAFVLTDLGDHELKGLSEPVHAWLAHGLADSLGRFHATREVDHLTPLVGRQEELALLLRRWEQATDAERQVVLISGEAGIGKSRLVYAFIERLGNKDQALDHVQLQCSSFHSNSSYFPFIQLLARRARFSPGDSPRDKLDKLRAVVEAADSANAIEAVSLLAEILGIHDQDFYPPLQLGAAEKKEKTLQVLLHQVLGSERAATALFILEDAQWADPSTLDAINAISDRGNTERSLVIITYRPEFANPWSNHPNVTHLPLGRLTRREAVMMVEQIAGDKSSILEMTEAIVARTDGIPLFIEEVGRVLRESNPPRSTGLTADVNELIPPSVQDALTARLDRLSLGKEVAQIGAVIGREFMRDLVMAVSSRTDAELNQALNQLLESGLVFRSGHGPQEMYTFRHGLVQEVAYQSLLKSRRQELHQSVATQIEQRFPNIESTQPEQLAHHCYQAGLMERAARLWLRAGRLAKNRLALSEAIHHARRGVEAMSNQNATANQELTIDLLTLLGDLESQMSLLDEANRHYREAAGLSEEPERRRRIDDKLHHPRYVMRGGARIVYHEHGAGDDTLLFINPIAYALGTFQSLVERLCHEFQIITVQCRGAGASDPLVRPYRNSDHLEDVCEIIREIGRPVIGVGISRGSNLLAALAAQYPVLVKKLALIGNPICDLMANDNPFPLPQAYLAERAALYQRQDAKALIELHMALIYPEPEMRQVREQSIRTLLALPTETIMSFFDLDPTLDIRRVLSKIAVPTLVANGTNDLIAPVASGRFICERILGAQFYEFKGKGHLPMFTAVDEFCDVLRRFVADGSNAPVN
jgi:class 3 adenylate cyclase/pimeloyl-ACP methyl ester carboxylesterase